MAALDRKVRKKCGDPLRDTFCASVRGSPCGSATALLECEPDRPPRLCRKDLKEPERFHRRLVDWLMKQR